LVLQLTISALPISGPQLAPWSTLDSS